MRAGLYLNRHVFELAEAVVVHSPWCRAEVGRLFPEHLEKTVVVPLGSRSERVAAERRAAARARFDLPATDLIFGSFGIMSLEKMNGETIDAFAKIAVRFPTSLFLFVGQDWENGEARRRTEGLGLGARVKVLGRQSAQDYADLVASIDIGISMRRPPTYGETSAALLDLLRVGIPTIVTGVATFSEYPNSVVRKVRWDAEGPSRLVRAMEELASDSDLRRNLGRSARSHVAEHHAWPRAAGMYASLIESNHAKQRRRRSQAMPAFTA
jgi:glycosyltransferase involved in cell wall biosynthesis